MKTEATQNLKTSSKLKTLDIAYIGMFVAILTVFSWISVPYTVPFTLQTLAVFLTASLLGTKRSVLTIIAYILLGATGLPVFQGPSGGVAILFGTTGGYIIGFVFAAIIIGTIISHFGKKTITLVVAMLLGMVAYFTFGTVWFMLVYAAQTGPIGILTALSWCVFPFILPDLCKMAIAIVVFKRVARFIPE